MLASNLVEDASVDEPRMFGRYRVTGTLGAGGMGEVYAAIDDVLGREVAVKTLRGNESGLAARLADERFRQEARAIAALSHPGVVQVFDLDLSAEPPYIVMERVVGPSLKERIAETPLAPAELRALGIQIAGALAAAHATGILHRDVKPANILAASGGVWKLADFGVAHIPDSELTMTGQFVGSPVYAPPEALVRGISGPPGDVFGLGAALYQAATGRWPRAEATSGALLAPLPPIAELAPELPVDLAQVIDRAVAVEPDDRPTAEQLAEQLAVADPDTIANAPAAAAPDPGKRAVVSGPTMDPAFVDPAAAVRLGTAPTVIAPPPRSRRTAWIVGALLVIGVAIVVLLGRATSGSGGSTADDTSTNDRVTKPREGTRPPKRPRTDKPHEGKKHGHEGKGAAPVTDPDFADDTGGGDDEIGVAAPAITNSDDHARRDWDKVIDKLAKRDTHEARKKLDEFERKWGESEETRALRDRIDTFPDVHDRDPMPPEEGPILHPGEAADHHED